MNIRDVHEQAKSYFADWIRVTDTETDVSLDSYDLKTGMTSNKFENHYWECVTVNKCWFVDDDSKKPEEFDYSQYIGKEAPLSNTNGLYHPHCHCKKMSIATPKTEDIIVVPLGKINDFFNRKDKLYFA